MPSEDPPPVVTHGLERYLSFVTEPGELVIYDRDRPEAWLTSDTYVVLSERPLGPGERPHTDAADDAPGSR